MAHAPGPPPLCGEAEELLAVADDDKGSLAADAAVSPRHSFWRRRIIITATVAMTLACLYLSAGHLKRRAFELRLAKYNEIVKLDHPITEHELEQFEDWRDDHDQPSVHWLVLPEVGPSSFQLAFFVKNARFINKENKEQTQVDFGLNEFSDEDPEQFLEDKTGLEVDPEEYLFALLNPNKTASKGPSDSYLGLYDNQDSQSFAESVDWVKKGAVTSVKTQDKCGSCYSFSAAGALEGAWVIHGANLTSLSNQEILDCSQSFGNEGCTGGTIRFSFEYLASAGACTYKNYPYKDKETKCRQDSCQVAVPAGAIAGWWKVKPMDENSLMGAVTQQPVSVGICASGIAFQNYKSGVLGKAYCGQQVDHAVVVVGYGHEEHGRGHSGHLGYWIMKNSWGTTWGEKGYARIQRGLGVNGNPTGVCAILSMPSFPQIASGSLIPFVVPEGPPKEDASCLPGDALVQVQGRGRVPVGSLGDEDLVLVHRGPAESGSLAYEPVLGFLHVVRAGPAALVAVTHEHGELRASANHLVFIRSASPGTGLSRMVGELRPGDILSVAVGTDANGDKRGLRGSRVLSVRRSTTTAGLFAPLTAAGTLIVDEVLASSYGAPSTSLRLPHAAAHGLLFPVRAYHALGLPRALASGWARLCGASDGSITRSWLCQGAGLSASSEEDMHPFAHFALVALRLDKLLHAA